MELDTPKPDDREHVGRRAQCRPRAHHWRPVRGSTLEVCTQCRTRFPCRDKCGHLDCWEVRGGELPMGITEVVSS